MKKRFLLLVGCALILVSCENNKNTQAQIQAMIDSTVNAKMARHDAENAAKNDSTLKAMEKEKAEAMGREQPEEKRAGKKSVKKIHDSAALKTQPAH